MNTINKKVACVPTDKLNIDAPQVKNGFAMPEERTHLFELTVAFDYWANETVLGLAKNDKIYLHSDAFRHDFMRQVFRHTDGTKFILVPYDLILAVDR